MKTLKKILEVYEPKPKDEKRFKDKHVVVKHDDANGNKDDVFQATNVKTVNRNTEHGYNPGQDEDVYEEVESVDEKTLTPAEMKKREEVAKAIQRENPGMDKSKKMAIATATAKRVAEEADQIDEISKATAKSYVGKKMDAIAAAPATTKQKVKKDLASLQRAHERIVGNKPTSEEVELDEKLTDDAKKNIQTALGPRVASSAMRKTSGPARAMIGLAKTNPANIVKEEEDVQAFLEEIFEQLDDDARLVFNQMIEEGQMDELLEIIDQVLNEEEEASNG